MDWGRDWQEAGARTYLVIKRKSAPKCVQDGDRDLTEQVVLVVVLLGCLL